MAAHDDDVLRFYRRYLALCNQHAWNELAPFLADTVVINEESRTRGEYIADLAALGSSFPDYRWELRRAIVQGDWLAVHLHDTGTRVEPFLDSPGDDAKVQTHEFAMYRISSGLIHEVEVTADNKPLTD